MNPKNVDPASPDEGEDTTWKRTLGVMAATQGLMMMAFTSSDTFMPLFIEQLGVADSAQLHIWSGIIFSSGFLISALAAPIWGSISDRSGRKLMVIRATLAVTVFTCLMGLTTSVWQLLAIRLLQGVFGGFSGAATALLATNMPEKRMGYALGWMASAAMFGSLIGPLAGGILVDLLSSYRAVFFLTSGFALTAFLSVALFIRKDTLASNNVPSKQKPTLLKQFRAVRELTGLRALFPVLFLAQFSIMSIHPVLPVYIKELTDGTEYLGTLAGFAISVTGMAGLIVSPILGKRGDKLGHRRMLTICMIGTGLFFLPQALAPNIWVLIASRFGLGLFIGGILPAANALVAHLTPIHQRGSVFGFTTSATLLGSFGGPLFGGLMSAAFGTRIMLAAVCVILLVNVLWVRYFVQDPPPSETDAYSASVNGTSK